MTRSPATPAGGKGTDRSVRGGILTERPFVIALLLVSFLGLAGCSPSLGPSASASSSASSGVPATTTAASATASAMPVESPAAFDACGLMTPAEVAAIVGGPEPVAKTVPAGGWVAGQCAWSSPEAAFVLSVGTSASIRSAGEQGVTGAKDKLAEFEQRNAASGPARSVAGIGEGASLSKAGIAAYQGEFYVEVVNLRLKDDEMIKIMKLAIAAL